jgi:hypothetical protein
LEFVPLSETVGDGWHVNVPESACFLRVGNGKRQTAVLAP